MEIKIIEYGSKEYNEMIELRIEFLLQPIGIPSSYIVPELEKNDVFIASFEDNKMTGCCVLTRRDKENVQLRQMAVLPEYRGNGIGAVIICFAEKIARENKFSTLIMHARDPVLDFYKKCGYEIEGEQFFEVGIGHHVMKKQLTAISSK